MRKVDCKFHFIKELDRRHMDVCIDCYASPDHCRDGIRVDSGAITVQGSKFKVQCLYRKVFSMF